MVIEQNGEDIRPPVARVLFPAANEIEDPPTLFRSVATVVPWDEEDDEDFPDPPVLERQHAGDGTAVVWTSDEEEEEDEDEDMETLSASSESTDGNEDFEERYQELMQQGVLLMEQIDHMVTLLGQRTFSNIPH